MKAVANLTLTVPTWVPKSKAHPNDRTTSTLKHLWNADAFKAEDIIYARRVYFSMCYESDQLLGEILTALDASGERDNTWVIMISDHGEDNYEHRQLGKNNMYDAASRVAMLVSGPGVKAGQKVSALTSLNDVYPTVLDMAGIPVEDLPSDLAGSSVLSLAGRTTATTTTTSSSGSSSSSMATAGRKDYVVAQYHSVFSVTGTFMIRQGDLKLIEYGPNAPYGDDFPRQLFNLSADPWELHDIAASSPQDVTRLSALLQTELNVTAVDARAKETQVRQVISLVTGFNCLNSQRNLVPFASYHILYLISSLCLSFFPSFSFSFLSHQETTLFGAGMEGLEQMPVHFRGYLWHG